jgi:hypothetical protein
VWYYCRTDSDERIVALGGRRKGAGGMPERRRCVLNSDLPLSSFLFPLDRRSIFPPDSDERIAALGGKRKGTGGMTER